MANLNGFWAWPPAPPRHRVGPTLPPGMTIIAAAEPLSLGAACWHALVLGVVQGLTEFLPISSTAHLKVVPVLLGWGDPGIAFTAVITSTRCAGTRRRSRTRGCRTRRSA